jgi:hypothetical protein
MRAQTLEADIISSEANSAEHQLFDLREAISFSVHESSDIKKGKHNSITSLG